MRNLTQISDSIIFLDAGSLNNPQIITWHDFWIWILPKVKNKVGNWNTESLQDYLTKDFDSRAIKTLKVQYVMSQRFLQKKKSRYVPIKTHTQNRVIIAFKHKSNQTQFWSNKKKTILIPPTKIIFEFLQFPHHIQFGTPTIICRW